MQATVCFQICAHPSCPPERLASPWPTHWGNEQTLTQRIIVRPCPLLPSSTSSTMTGLSPWWLELGEMQAQIQGKQGSKHHLCTRVSFSGSVRRTVVSNTVNRNQDAKSRPAKAERARKGKWGKHNFNSEETAPPLPLHACAVRGAKKGGPLARCSCDQHARGFATQ